ncbi:terpene synthase family protein [Streptomyces niger]|uniref:terpene synthase family protein n=1 Tax=Streptomyces niger TaxID=66373 RepID=UPI00069B8211|nr:hypothetical protein [Streptomyces niger]
MFGEVQQVTSTGRQGRVPKVYCPIPAAVHPEAAAAGERSIKWLASFGVFDADDSAREQTAGNRVGEAAGRAAPHAGGHGLQIFSDWVAAAFALDDLYCDMGPTSRRPEEFIPLMMRLLHRMDHPEAPGWDDSPLSAAFADLSRRVREFAPATLTRRWVDAHRGWMLGAAAGVAQHGAGGSPPEIVDHLVMRNWDGAMRANHALIEIAESTMLPSAQSERPAVRAATEAAYTLVLLGNDLYSYARELDAQATGTNCVDLLTPPGGTVEDGMDAVVRLHDRIMCLFLALRGQHAARPLTRYYLDQLAQYIRGNLDWSLTVPRYRTGTAGDSESDWAATAPSDDTLAAPRIPSIAWWWDQLRH